MKNIGIIGSGAMGSGIAQVAAMADCKVWIFDVNVFNDGFYDEFTIRKIIYQ